MAGFTFKSAYVTTPLKLVLPGIVVSMIGIFVNNYVFNNPEKIRGKNSRLAWDNLLQYEKIYSEFYEGINCQYDGTFNEDYVDDLLHIQEMTSENLKTLREDKDIDKHMATILNLRIDTYAKLKNVSKTFFDSLFSIGESATTEVDPGWHSRMASLSEKYMKMINRIYYRDTSIIRNLGADLKKKYPVFRSVNFSFVTANNLENLKDKIIGKWSILTSNQSIQFDRPAKGVWIVDSTGRPFTWNLDSATVKINFTDAPADSAIIEILTCTDRGMQAILRPEYILFSACRIKGS